MSGRSFPRAELLQLYWRPQSMRHPLSSHPSIESDSMKAVRCLCIAMTVLCGPASAQSAPQAPAAPNAPRQEDVVEWHGERGRQDPWFWLREKDSLPVPDYLKARTRWTHPGYDQQLVPFVDMLYKEMLGHIKQTDLGVRSAGAGSTTIRESGGQAISDPMPKGRGATVVRRKAAEEIILDQNELAKGIKFFRLAWFR